MVEVKTEPTEDGGTYEFDPKTVVELMAVAL
jgi:hypothetical protein